MFKVENIIGAVEEIVEATGANNERFTLRTRQRKFAAAAKLSGHFVGLVGTTEQADEVERWIGDHALYTADAYDFFCEQAEQTATLLGK